MPLLSLGPHVFEIAPLNFQELTRTTEAKWPEIARFGGDPSLQFTGYRSGAITISGVLYPGEFGGRDEYEAIRATQRAAKPVPMLGWAGQGMAARLFGLVVILTVDDTQSRFDRDGQPRRLTYDIDVAPYAGTGKPIGLFT